MAYALQIFAVRLFQKVEASHTNFGIATFDIKSCAALPLKVPGLLIVIAVTVVKTKPKWPIQDF